MRRFEDHGITVPIKHASNSAAAIQYPEMHLDMIRAGIALYRLYPSPVIRHPIINSIIQGINRSVNPLIIDG
ncbi:alanine racemase [Paenibacillus beijingensis]|uniref:alanine racemase n=1 Tax=Paenibacillus beijingensis TaxID=1126833 RepID=UPI0009E53566